MASTTTNTDEDIPQCSIDEKLSGAMTAIRKICLILLYPRTDFGSHCLLSVLRELVAGIIA